MIILITAPSLNPKKNVSGVSAVVNTIINYNREHNYFHYLLGRSDEQISKFKWIIKLIKQVMLFPVFVRRNKIDLVHQNLPFDPKGLLRESLINFWCWMLNVPVILHVHGGVFLMNKTSNNFYYYLTQRLFIQSKIVVVLSEIEKEALATKYNYTKSLVLMNSVDISQFDYINNQRKLEIRSILFLGRIHESKGVYEIIEALRILHNEITFRFILCGDGPLRNMFVKECSTILGSNFEYRGVVSGVEKLKVISESDFFILPSRYGEGLPMALLESMAAGLVPIVTDDASMKFVVKHNVNGLMVEKRNANDLYEKLKNVFSNQELFKKLSLNAKNTISEHYDIKNYIVKLNDLYKEAIAK